LRLDRPAIVGVGVSRSTASLEKPGFDAFRWPLISGGLLFCLIVGAMYAPAYIFRGRAAMHDQILKPVTLVEQASAQWQGLLGAWEWWTTGFPPAWVWGTGLVLGALLFRSTWADRVRWLALPVSMLGLHLVGQVAPPPRVFIILLPSIAMLAAAGWGVGASSRGRYADRVCGILAAIVAIGGTAYAFTHPVLIYPQERTSFRSVREAMLDLKPRIAADAAHSHRLIAPLPCDLPSIFYRDREGITVQVNGAPHANEVVWLLSRHGETPEDVLKTPLVNLPNVAGQRAPFEEVAKLETLILYRSAPR